MRFISHRGNYQGPSSIQENDPYVIERRFDDYLSNGIFVECDLWLTDALYLGHDRPQYKVDGQWIYRHKDFLYLHAKNREALEFIVNCQIEGFFHDRDDFTLTYNGYIWAYPGILNPGKKTIIVLPERSLINVTEWSVKEFYKEHGTNWFGMCTDYPEMFRKIYNDNDIM